MSVAPRRGGESRGSLTDRVYAHVKERILAGGYAGGSLISEGEVAEAVQASRTPVREAFLRLEAEGFLRLYPRRGALVVPVSASEIRDLLDARQVIERHAAETAIHTGRHHEVAAQLRAILKHQQDSRAPHDAHWFSDLDRQFHGALVDAAGNRLLADFYASLRDRQLRMGTAALQRNPDRYGSILAEHAALADLLDAGDVAALGSALASHLDATKAALASI